MGRPSAAASDADAITPLTSTGLPSVGRSVVSMSCGCLVHSIPLTLSESHGQLDSQESAPVSTLRSPPPHPSPGRRSRPSSKRRMTPSTGRPADPATCSMAKTQLGTRPAQLRLLRRSLARSRKPSPHAPAVRTSRRFAAASVICLTDETLAAAQQLSTGKKNPSMKPPPLNWIDGFVPNLPDERTTGRIRRQWARRGVPLRAQNGTDRPTVRPTDIRRRGGEMDSLN